MARAPSMTIVPSEAEFLRLARQGNVIPVYGELVADLETPVSAFLKLDDGRYSYLLESVEGQEHVARYSFLGSRPRLLFTSRGREVTVTELDHSARRPRARAFQAAKGPVAELARLLKPYRPVRVPGLPRFCGGMVGYFGYDLVHFFERLPAHQVQDLDVPDMTLMLTDAMVVFDHARHRMQLVVNAFLEDGAPAAVYRRAVRRIQAMAQALNRPLKARPSARPRARRSDVRSNATRPEFERMVEQAKRYIRAGDIIQVVLSQRFERPVSREPFELYRALRSLNPSPYMYFLRLDGLCLAGASPEMLVRCEDGALETRPIAGTRRRGRDAADDERLAQQLLDSPKERAEHLMLVDLGRNDLGRVAVVGSVKTPELMVVEKYSHVLHLVSGVTAKLRPGRTAFDVLRATFPAGTVSGAPKVRAMEIIAELERTGRGPYAGAVGYLDFSGNLDTCITIRTIVIKDGTAYVQAGAGIVADSHPGREYQETVSKARAMLQAIELAEQGRIG